MFRHLLLFAISAGCLNSLLAAENTNLGMLNRIKTEAFDNSRVMEHAFYLTDVYGPRLTNTPNFKSAGEWVAKRLNEYGLSNVHLEPWGPYGRGWSFSHYSGHLIEPQHAPLIGVPLVWSRGTSGPVSGEPMLAIMRTEADFEKYKGKLKGRIVLTDPGRTLEVQTSPPSRRFSDAELIDQSTPVEPTGSGFTVHEPAPPATDNPFSSFFTAPGAGPPAASVARVRAFRNKMRQFLIDEGAAVWVQIGRGDGGTVFAQSAGNRDTKEALSVPALALAAEHYNRIVRLIAMKIPVKVEFDIKADIYENSLDSFNIVGEIPGGSKKDELVMVGAHFDSWQGGTGATDNGAGSAVMMEVMRVLKSLHTEMDRTVRIVLWSGEEGGLLGSKAYVKAHFADPEKMNLMPEHSKVSAYYNYDNGTGKVRGVYLQGNDMARPIFESWLAPLKDLGATTATIRNTAGTDHLSFDAVGIPGFQFIQDQIEYASRTHHSNMDVYDRLQKGDLMQASAVISYFVYNTAMRADPIPRKPLPKAKPAPKPEAAATTSGTR
jgi:carboxypeptidase Q